MIAEISKGYTFLSFEGYFLKRGQIQKLHLLSHDKKMFLDIDVALSNISLNYKVYCCRLIIYNTVAISSELTVALAYLVQYPRCDKWTLYPCSKYLLH
jgi:hypothetical protein